MNPFRFSLAAILLTGLLAPVQAGAQSISPRVSPNIIIGIPANEFADNVDNIGFGLGVTGGVGFGTLPIMIGLDLGYMVYGIERRSEPFSTTIPDVRVDVETTNNIFQAHLVLRVQPQTGAVQPYIEGLFGFKYLFTRTSIKNIPTDETVVSSTNFDDFASSFGPGAGVDIRLWEAERTTILLHLGCRYLLGSVADYLERGSIERLNGEVIFDVISSRTDFILPQLGATFTF